MPRVVKTHFDYTPEGKAKAKLMAKNTGGKVEYDYGKGKGNELSGTKPRKPAASRRKPGY